MTQTLEASATAFAIIAAREELSAALAAVCMAVRPRVPKPALGCVLLEAGERELTLCTTDLEIAIRYVCRQVQIDARGAVLVNAAALREWVAMLDDETVKIELGGDTLMLSGSSANRTLYTLPLGDFPPAPAEEKEVATFVVTAGAFAAAAGFVKHAIAEKSTQYAYSAMLLERAKSSLIFVATDGHRLATTAIGDGKLDGEHPNILIPANAVDAALRMPLDGDLTLGIGESAVRIECGDTTLWTQRLQGAFPLWRNVIPKDGNVFLIAGRESLMAEIRRAAAACVEEVDSRTSGIRVELSAKGVAMTSRSPERGTSAARLPCKVTGGALTIGLNPKFLLEALGGMAGEDVELAFTAPNQPVKITCGAMTEVVMPMNLQE